MSEHTRRFIVEKTRDLLVGGNRFGPIYRSNRTAYRIMESIIRRRLAGIPGVETIYLTHGQALGECYPGLTDFDLVVLFSADDRLAFYDTFRPQWRRLRRYLPVNDVSLVTSEDFAHWQTLGGGLDPLDEVQHWRCLWGTDQRQGNVDLEGDHAVRDRLRYGLGHFQNLMQVAVKEEHKSPVMAVVARRQLYKEFWRSVWATDKRYMAIANETERVRTWIADHGDMQVVQALREMYRTRFHRGPASRLRFSASALAYRCLNEWLSCLPMLDQPLDPPQVMAGPPIAPGNHDRALERGEAMTRSLLEMLGEQIETTMLSSTGSVRGYAFYLILRDDLSDDELVRALVDARTLFRVFDDPWFNEHFPAGMPIICSSTMFKARLHTAHRGLHYFARHRHIFHGKDLFREAVGEIPAGADCPACDEPNETLAYSLHLNQIYLNRLKPALFDYVTFYAPRIALLRQDHGVPATAEEALMHFSRQKDCSHLPQQFMTTHRHHDLDALMHAMQDTAFREAWPFLQAQLREREPAA